MAFVLVPLVGIVFSLYLAKYVRGLEQTQFESAFSVRGQQTNSNIRISIGDCYTALTWIADMCTTETQFSRERFDSISRRAFDRLTYLESLRYVPLVPASERAAFEQRMKQQLGAAFRITDYETGRTEKAPQRDYYFPIVYCANRGLEPAHIGYNIDSNAQSHEKMLSARNTGAPTMHPWTKATETGTGMSEFSYMVFVPIFADTPATAPRRLTGYIQAFISASKLIESFVSRTDMAGLAIEIRDHGTPIYRSRDGQRVQISNTNWYSSPAIYSIPLTQGDIDWRVNFWATQDTVSLADWWRMWSLPGLVLVVSLLVGYYFIDSSLHSWQMEEMVVRRTHELSDTNRQLSREVSVRQRTELALRDNEARLEGILTSMADSWVIVYDSEYHCESMWIPPELENRYDLRPENIVGRPIQEITPAALSEQRMEDIRKVFDDGVNLRVEFLMELPHAEYWVEAAMSPLRDPDGRTNAVICLMRDVSERKRAEQALAESEGRYRSMVESQVDMVVRIDPGGRLTFVNDAYCRKTGLKREQLLGRTEIGMVHEADRASAEASIKKLLDPPHERSSREQRMMTVLGVRWVHWESAAVLDEHGRLVEIQSVGRDITERRNAEQEHLLLAEAVEQAAEAIFITDLDGIIQYVNPAFEHITGYARSEVLGAPHQILRKDLMNNDFYRKLWKTLEAGRIWRGHFTNRRKDGTVFDQLATISPVHDATGQITHFVSVELDMTNEKRLERQLRQAERLATIGQTIAGIAHRLKNISALIRGSASLLDQAVHRDDMASIKRLWPIFPRNSERLANLANDMLNFARVHDLDIKPHDLNDLLRKLVEEYTASARQRGVELRLSGVQPLPPVRCDQKKIHDCVLNLVQNAVEACEPQKGCTVTVATACEESHAVIEVADDGPGIPPEVLPHIYEPFFSTKEEKGTGLGLPMTQKTIHGHGGTIKVQSQPGHTEFKIYLPLGETAVAEDVAAIDSANPKA
ncbi:PAS domain S-box protein [bacterium]|nr:PAS domain S-box protein [bacterium]